MKKRTVTARLGQLLDAAERGVVKDLLTTRSEEEPMSERALIRELGRHVADLKLEVALLRAVRNSEIALGLKRMEFGKDHGKELMREQRALYTALIELQEFDAKRGPGVI